MGISIRIHNRWLSYEKDCPGPFLIWDDSWIRPGESFRNIIYLLAERNYSSTSVILQAQRYPLPNVPNLRNRNYYFDLTIPTVINLDGLAAKMRTTGDLRVHTLLPLMDAWFTAEHIRSYPGQKGHFFKGLVASGLRFCPLCMEDAYHGILQQFLSVRCCLRHSVPVRLIENCPRCSAEVPILKAWTSAEGKPNPRSHCPHCLAPLTEAERNEASEAEIRETEWVTRLWQEVSDPSWIRFPLADVVPLIESLLERRRWQEGLRWRAPVSTSHLHHFLYPPSNQDHFLNLADLLQLFRALDVTPVTLRSNEREETIIRRRSMGPEDWRPHIVAAIREGVKKIDIMRRFHISEITLQRCINTYASDGTLTRHEAKRYHYHPRCTMEQRNTAKSMMESGASTYAICKATGLTRLAVMGIRFEENGAGLGLEHEPPHRWERRSVWSLGQYREARRAELLQVLDRLKATGKPLVMSDLHDDFGPGVGLSFRGAHGPFGGLDGREFRMQVQRRLLETWVRTYPDPQDLKAALAGRSYRNLRTFAKKLGYLPD